MGGTTIISIVNTDVVLCEYLPQECTLWGTIKGYCIVYFKRSIVWRFGSHQMAALQIVTSTSVSPG